MIEEIKTDNNCIVKAFENNPISILHENVGNKKIYFFKSSDIGKALDLKNIAVSIQCYDEDEKVLRKAYDLRGCEQDTTFLTSQGVYRLLYNSKKEVAKKFRKWAGNILDDIIFNESNELKLQLENQKTLLEEKEKQLLSLQKLKTKKWYNQTPRDTVYAFKVENIIKIGKSKNIKERECNYMWNQNGDMFYIRDCYNCDLVEKVIHHILDKHREENNKEWFNISNELAIYTINIVCDFLDNFINCSENLPLSKIKESFDTSLELIKTYADNTDNTDNTDKKDNKDNTDNTYNKDDIIEQSNERIEIIKSSSLLNKIVKIESNEDKFNRFIKECCELNENNYVLSYEILGAYRIWSRGFTAKDRTYFTQFMKNNFKSRRKYYKEYNESNLKIYLGIKPKELIIQRENKNILPKYEEFILDECKYNYTYRIKYSTFLEEYKKWCNKKYPEYIFSKEEKINIEAYINRHFLKDNINMPGCRNVPGIWGIQLKSDNLFMLGVNPTHRKQIVKVDYKTKKIIEEYKSIVIACETLNFKIDFIRDAIKNKRIIQDYILEYKNDIHIED